MKLLDMLAAIIQNMASHPDNRTHMYRAELAGTAALDRVLEGPPSPVSPEPVNTSAALLASRLTGAAAAAQRERAASPSALQPGRCASPTTTAPLPQLQQPGDSIGASLLSASVDSALAAAAVVRPKVVFPPISRSTVGLPEGEAFRAGSPTAGWPSPPATAAAGAGNDVLRGLAGGCRPSALVPPHSGGHGLRGGVGGRSAKSRAATSVAGMPGSPTAAPDSREQFLIWMDSTFVDVSDGISMRAQSPQYMESR